MGWTVVGYNWGRRIDSKHSFTEKGKDVDVADFTDRTDCNEVQVWVANTGVVTEKWLRREGVWDKVFPG